MQKNDYIRIACFGLGAAVMFYLAPLLLDQAPDLVRENGKMILILSLNHVLMIAVGWQSNYLSKYGIYMPFLMVLLYLLSELCFYQSISWSVEANYIESGYLAYFLKKFWMRNKRREEKKNNKPFPKGVGRK